MNRIKIPVLGDGVALVDITKETLKYNGNIVELTSSSR